MKRNILLAGIITTLLLTGCQKNNNNAETEALKQQIAQLEQQITELEQKGTEVTNDNAAAVVPETTETTEPSAETTTEPPAETTTEPAAENNTGAEGTTNTTTTGTTNTLEELTTMVNDFVTKAEAAAPGTDDAANMEQFFSLKKEGNQIDNALDRHENELEKQYRDGTLTRDELRQADRELEQLEDLLDNAEDRLEYTFGIDD